MVGSLIPPGGLLQSQDDKISGEVDMHALKTLQESLAPIKNGTFVLRMLNDHCIVLFVDFQVCIMSPKHLNY